MEGLFELTQLPSRALDSPRVLIPELQRNKDTVRCAALGAEVARTPSRPTYKNVECAFSTNAQSSFASSVVDGVLGLLPLAA